MCPSESKVYEVSKIAKIEKQLEDNNKWLEDTNRKLDILLARESSTEDQNICIDSFRKN